eukprot:IDg4440t1
MRQGYLAHLLKCEKLIIADYLPRSVVVIKGVFRSYVTLCVTLPTNEYSSDCASRVLIISPAISQWPVYPSWVLVGESSSCDGRHPASIVTLHNF